MSKLTGKVKPGTNNAEKMMTDPTIMCGMDFKSEIEKRSEFKLVPGTLNIELDISFILSVDFQIKGIHNGNNETYSFQKCKIGAHKCLIFRSDKTCHPENIVEIMSEVQLRSTFNLVDGSDVTVETLK